MWVNFDPSPFVGLHTEHSYRIRFNLPADFSDASMKYVFNADNQAWMYVNGQQVAPNAQWDGRGRGPEMTADTSMLTAGTNEIILKLTDTGGWVGFNYRIDLTVETTRRIIIQSALGIFS
jgi:hypothetical protein